MSRFITFFEIVTTFIVLTVFISSDGYWQNLFGLIGIWTIISLLVVGGIAILYESSHMDETYIKKTIMNQKDIVARLRKFPDTYTLITYGVVINMIIVLFQTSHVLTSAFTLISFLFITQQLFAYKKRFIDLYKLTR
jgi:hypothetical protein